ncbi:MAG: hypothetical protein ACUVXE_03290 [Anaerolineae bacterium]
MPKTTSLEHSLWVILLLLATGLRLVGLGAVPLSSDEAVQALAAYQTAHRGSIPPEAQTIPPLLFHINVLLFALFRGGDGLVRLLPALCGVGLALTPLLLRQYLGRWGALGSGLMLALSPTLLALSRTLDGSIPAALGVMLLVGAVAHFLDSWRSAWIPLGGIGLALALTAGPTAWGLLLGLALALAGGLWVWREQVSWVWPMVRPALGRGLAVFALGLFAFGAGLGLHPAGLAATGEQFLRWLSPGAGHQISLALPVLASEPLLLVAGLAGAILALSRRHGMGLLWLFWTLVGALWGIIRPAPAAPILWLVPLAGLGGLAVEALARALQRGAPGAYGWTYGTLSLTLWAHSGLVLTRYSRYAQSADLLLVGIGLALQGLLILFLGVALSVPKGNETPEEATRRALFFVLHLAALVLGIVLLAVNFAAGWRVAAICPGDPSCAPIVVPAPTAPELRLLVQEIPRLLDRIGAQGDTEHRLWLVDPDPAVAWALRGLDFQSVPAERLEGEETPALIVAPAQASVPEGYYGTVFTLRRAWLPPQSPYQWVRWALYREPPSPPQSADRITLWVREDLILVSSGSSLPRP